MAPRWLRGWSSKTVPALGRLDDYCLLRELGRGATAVVYLAEGPRGDHHALKVPLQGSESLLREARFLQSIESPNVVRCLGVCRGQTPYLRMELLEGETLAQRLSSRGRLPMPALDRLLAHALRGLQAVHDLGVVHTDLKPSNMFLSKQGRRQTWKLMDFGLALKEGEFRQDGAQGTAIYAAPEQWGNRPLDRRADLYSLGVVLYEAATGLLPWGAQEPVALLALKSQGTTGTVRRFRPDFSAARERLLAEMLCPEPEGRPSSVSDVLKAWERP